MIRLERPELPARQRPAQLCQARANRRRCAVIEVEGWVEPADDVGFHDTQSVPVWERHGRNAQVRCLATSARVMCRRC